MSTRCLRICSGFGIDQHQVGKFFGHIYQGMMILDVDFTDAAARDAGMRSDGADDIIRTDTLLTTDAHTDSHHAWLMRVAGWSLKMGLASRRSPGTGEAFRSGLDHFTHRCNRTLLLIGTGNFQSCSSDFERIVAFLS